jgi:hypothetical protein
VQTGSVGNGRVHRAPRGVTALDCSFGEQTSSNAQFNAP